MRKKRLLLVSMAILLFFPSFLVHATSNNENTDGITEEEEALIDTDGEFESKDEVVYATMSATGEQQEIYVVNILDVTKAGTIVDYGKYNAVTNLTDLSEIEVIDNKVILQAPTGKFYYQGNMTDEQLPWDFTISYFLDGKEIEPEKLSGKDGRLQIMIKTSANEDVDKTFFEHYLLQISLTIPSEVMRNVEAPDATIANAGKKQQINFTVMPEQEEVLRFAADVTEFEMDAIEIAGIPSSMAIDVDVNGMTDDIKTLADAIREINDGVSELKSGVTDLNKGVRSLRDGSAQYNDGMNEVSGASSELIDGSAQINEMIQLISSSVSEGLGEINIPEIDVDELEQLPEELKELAKTLQRIADELDNLETNYSEAYDELDRAMENIPEYSISDEEIEELYESGVDRELIDRLLETHEASVTALEAYREASERFDSIEVSFSDISNVVREWSESLDTIASEMATALEEMDNMNYLEELEEGLNEFSSGYEEFHSGLISYTDGVSELARSYRHIHTGIVELADGTSELESGVGELGDGTDKLYEATSDMPDQMREEIDKMIAEFDRSDFDPVSFVSDNNDKINTVQFVIKTEKIQIDSDKKESTEEEEEKGFWAKLLDLFFLRS
ncbi:YhgE/Pip domain-containing protein [Evansella sp. AB-P1]|uniref:YhgE/Pip domain-containing protein n=1 Tax=Evansella sp. AB-P1 TaxID=3037653 RepID=UPI00241C162B|nr:YhgE/Pip domain-containing protein [Evansella sp. AB-P1]MDG5788980.1 YhgE/Pip domain-containing protein [Evansella sp. AB-P1]